MSLLSYDFRILLQHQEFMFIQLNPFIPKYQADPQYQQVKDQNNYQLLQPFQEYFPNIISLE